MSMSWSMVGPAAAFSDLFKVRVSRTHALHGLAHTLAKDDGDDVEEDQHRRLVEAAHRQDALATLVVGHRLRAHVDYGIPRGRHLPFRLRCDGDRPGARPVVASPER